MKQSGLEKIEPVPLFPICQRGYNFNCPPPGGEHSVRCATDVALSASRRVQEADMTIIILILHLCDVLYKACAWRVGDAYGPASVGVRTLAQEGPLASRGKRKSIFVLTNIFSLRHYLIHVQI